MLPGIIHPSYHVLFMYTARALWFKDDKSSRMNTLNDINLEIKCDTLRRVYIGVMQA